MKGPIVLLGLLAIVQVCRAQTPQESVPYPCVEIDGNQLATSSDPVSAQCIHLNTEEGGVTLSGNITREYSGNEIRIDKGISILPSGGGVFRATSLASCNLVHVFEPAGFNGTIECFEKLEFGIELTSQLETHISNFITNSENNNTALQPTINPFNPEELDIRLILEREVSPGNWQVESTHFAFYYQDYYRCQNCTSPPRPYDNYWGHAKVATQHPMRIRLTPRVAGNYRFHIEMDGTLVTPCSGVDYLLIVTPGSYDKDFVRVSQNGKYFQLGPNEGTHKIFFPVGQNLIEPSCECDLISRKQFMDQFPGDPLMDESACLACYQLGTSDPCTGTYWHSANAGHSSIETLPKITHQLKYEYVMEQLAQGGANAFKQLIMPWNYDIEFEDLGNYSKRMNFGWELDNVVEKSHELGLKMVLDLQYQSTLGNPSYYQYWNWDWSSNPDDNCALPGTDTSPATCYSTQIPGIGGPDEFFTNSTAKQFWKNKLRYIISRWGYSSDIYLIELYSEINGAASEAEFVLDGSDCIRSETGGFSYYEDPTTKAEHRLAIAEWVDEMAAYIKNDLDHNQHLLTVNNAGRGPLDEESGSDNSCGAGTDCFDWSFTSPYIDVVSWNNYDLSLHKYENMAKRPSGNEGDGGSFYTDGLLTNDIQYEFYPGEVIAIAKKPVIFGECGGGNETIMSCDKTGWLKDLYATPFTGLAGTGMSWDETRSFDLWLEYGKLNYFLQNFFLNEVDLEDDNWFPGYAEMEDDGEHHAECVFMQYSEPNHHRFVGVIFNRSWNFITVNDGFGDCLNPTFTLNDEYSYLENRTPHDVNYVSNNEMRIKWNCFSLADLGDEYQLEYFDPDNLEYEGVCDGDSETGPVHCETSHVSIDGLDIKSFPTLSFANKPVLFFRAFRNNGEDVFSTKSVSQTSSDLSQFSNSLSRFETGENADAAIKGEVIVYPNPTSDFLMIKSAFNDQYKFFNEQGILVGKGSVKEGLNRVDISDLAVGFYFISIEGQHYKFVIQR